MRVSTPNLYPVHLSEEQRERLSAISRNGHAPVKKVRHAQVLLLSDHERPAGPLSRTRIAESLGMHVNSVDRVRKRFVLEGEQPALERKPRATPPVPSKIDGRVEAHLIAICCGAPPEGRSRWSLRLIAGELSRRRIVTQVSAETVRRALKKTSSSPGRSDAGASPSGTRPASSRSWKTCSTSTPPTTANRSR
jgi:transposase